VTPPAATAALEPSGLVRGLGLFDSVMIVAGTMIGSAVFIVAADITRNVGSSGWLLVVWIVTGVLALVARQTHDKIERNAAAWILQRLDTLIPAAAHDNDLLAGVFASERYLMRRVALPIGVSLLATVRV